MYFPVENAKQNLLIPLPSKLIIEQFSYMLNEDLLPDIFVIKFRALPHRSRSSRRPR